MISWKYILCSMSCWLAFATTATVAQTPRLFAQPRPGYGGMPQPLAPPSPDDFYRDAERGRRMAEYSWIYVDPPRPREVKVHDIVTIIVDEKSEVTLNSRYNRTRTANLKAELKDFVRITERNTLGNAAANQPTIDGNLQGRLQSNGQATDQEGIRYRIAATVVDVRPNGVLVLEARKSIRTNDDLWQYSLTGKIRIEDINRDNTALSEDIAELDIVKKQNGKVYNSTKRPWGVKLYDLFSPF